VKAEMDAGKKINRQASQKKKEFTIRQMHREGRGNSGERITQT
jgi:hypothetical protein